MASCERLSTRVARWVAWKLPHQVALWAMIRLAAHASTDKWGHVCPSDLTYGDMHDRWCASPTQQGEREP